MDKNRDVSDIWIIIDDFTNEAKLNQSMAKKCPTPQKTQSSNKNIQAEILIDIHKSISTITNDILTLRLINILNFYHLDETLGMLWG